MNLEDGDHKKVAAKLYGKPTLTRAALTTLGLKSSCTCTGCTRCEPAAGPCTRAVTVNADNRCQECHDRAAEICVETQP